MDVKCSVKWIKKSSIDFKDNTKSMPYIVCIDHLNARMSVRE